MRTRTSISGRLVFVALTLIASGAAAQEIAAEAPSALMERGTLRLRYGVSLRQGQQQDLGPGVSYQGLTPNDLALAASWFPARLFGLSVSAQREGFALLDGGQRVTGGALIRASAGPTARLLLGPLKLEAHAGYQLAELPAFDSSVAPQLTVARRHGVLLASRISLGLPLGIVAEARGEYPLVLQVSDAGGTGSSRGFAGGGGISFPVHSTDSTDLRLALDYQYVQDELTSSSGATASQRLSRIGAALELDFLPPGVPRPPKVGGIAVLVLAEETGKPLEGAQVVLVDEDGVSRPVRAGQSGQFWAEELEPGEQVAKVTAAGYLPAEGRAEVIAGQVAALELRVKKEPPKVGTLVVKVAIKGSNAPLANAVVKLREQELTTDESGAVTIPDLAPGLVSVKIEAPGFKAGEEVAQVVVNKTSELPVLLVKEKQKVPATISGTVRNRRGGAPVRARLQIPELSLEVRADEQGSFSFSVPSGTFRVIIAAPGFRQQTKQVTVREGDQTIFNVDLHPRGR